MKQETYIFDRAQHVREKCRLIALEAVHDRATRKRLRATGIGVGWHCLEVGPGTGSIMRWLAKRVGVKGQVMALDVNPRFVSQTRLPQIIVQQGDICRGRLPRQAYDLIHCRHVLIHTASPKKALKNMIGSLKSGGWIILEEPDFSSSRALAGSAGGCQAVVRVNAAIHEMFHKLGRDPGFGSRLPALVQPYGLTQLAVEHEVPISPGRSPIATLMNLSAQQLQKQYLETGKASLNDIRSYRRFTRHANSWAVYYGTVALFGKKP